MRFINRVWSDFSNRVSRYFKVLVLQPNTGSSSAPV
jgi:hypothetical protein